MYVPKYYKSADLSPFWALGGILERDYQAK